jgi:hypothetical protein
MKRKFKVVVTETIVREMDAELEPAFHSDINKLRKDVKQVAIDRYKQNGDRKFAKKFKVVVDIKAVRG